MTMTKTLTTAQKRNEWGRKYELTHRRTDCLKTALQYADKCNGGDDSQRNG